MRILAAILIFSLCSTGEAFAADDAALEGFVRAYADRIQDQLNCIHSHKMTEQDRFLVLQTTEGGYIQCLFHDNDTQIYCEASSGYYGNKQATLADAELQALQAKGFDIYSGEGNYPLHMPVTGYASLREIALRMLRASYMAYGARVGAVTTFGPFADICLYIS